MKPILLLQTGDVPAGMLARHGNFDAMFARASAPIRLVRVHVARGEQPPDPGSCRGAVVSGSHSFVTERLPWSERAGAWLRDARASRLPMFGVCYGHQLMARAFGGEVDWLPGGGDGELGSLEVTLTEAGRSEPLLSGFPGSFRCHLAHSQTVRALPPGATALARSARDPHQIVAYGHSVFSVQFHPEFDRAVMLSYIDMAEAARPDGKARYDELRRDAADTGESALLLRRFLAGLDARRGADAASPG